MNAHVVLEIDGARLIAGYIVPPGRKQSRRRGRLDWVEKINRRFRIEVGRAAPRAMRQSVIFISHQKLMPEECVEIGQ
jgi:hypothetical protein